MVSKKRKKAGKKVKNLPVKSLSSRQAKDVKGGMPVGPPQKSIADGTSNT